MRSHIVIPALLIAFGVSSAAFAQADAGNAPWNPRLGSGPVQNDGTSSGSAAAAAPTSVDRADTTRPTPTTGYAANRATRGRDLHRFQPDQETVPGNAAFGRVGTP